MESPILPPTITRDGAKRICFALFLAIALASVCSAVFDTTRSGMVLRGDFPAFYAAGELSLLEAPLESLYDVHRQQEVQNRAWPSLSGRMLVFAYPPFVADFFSAFALLDSPIAAKLLFSSAMLLCLWFACGRLEQLGVSVLSSRATTFCLLISTLPITTAVLAGQNTALSMLLVFSAIVFLSKVGRGNEAAAGICVALLAFKPQLSIIALLFLFTSSRYRACASALVVYALLFVISALSFGFDWPLRWLGIAESFSARDMLTNGHQMLSLNALSHLIGSALGTSTAASKAFGAIASMALLFSVAYANYRQGGRGSAEQHARGHDAMLCSMVFLSPHSLFYEFGLLALPLMRLWPKEQGPLAAALLWLLIAVCSIFRDSLNFQPLAVFSAFLFCLSFWRLLFSDMPSRK